jgi:hypothetical protein
VSTNAMKKPMVLLVDDDRSILDALGAVIESEGFGVVRAANGHEAMERFRRYCSRFDSSRHGTMVRLSSAALIPLARLHARIGFFWFLESALLFGRHITFLCNRVFNQIA